MRPIALTRLLECRVRSTLLLLRSREGGTAMEYGLIAALIALTILGGLQTLGSSLIELPLPKLIATFERVLS